MLSSVLVWVKASERALLEAVRLSFGLEASSALLLKLRVGECRMGNRVSRDLFWGVTGLALRMIDRRGNKRAAGCEDIVSVVKDLFRPLAPLL